MGLVFHPGHEELHGVTVVVRGRSGRTYVGRYHERTGAGLVLRDVAVHEPALGEGREAWLGRLLRYGIRVERAAITLPEDEVGEVARLTDGLGA
jgi:hypothetical protein